MISEAHSQEDSQGEEQENEVEETVNREQSIEKFASKELPKNKECVSYKLVGEEERKNGKVISRAGKATGINRFFLNIKDLDDETEACVDWRDGVTEWKKIDNVLTMVDDGFEQAKQNELSSWKSLGVYDEVIDVGQRTISVRWVCTEKEINGEKKNKARLVARGYEEDEMESFNKDSPTCSKESLRAMITVINAKFWKINSLDIKTAFLQGKEIDREIYLKPPKEAGVKGYVWKLKRCVYGLCDASRWWYKRVHDELVSFGCTVSKHDPAVFMF